MLKNSFDQDSFSSVPYNKENITTIVDTTLKGDLLLSSASLFPSRSNAKSSSTSTQKKNNNKLRKSNENLERQVGGLQKQMQEAQDQIVLFKKEKEKLRRALEKSDNQVKALNAILVKINEESKIKEELLKKNSAYIQKLENQIIKQNTSGNSIESTKILEERCLMLEREKQDLERKLKENIITSTSKGDSNEIQQLVENIKRLGEENNTYSTKVADMEKRLSESLNLKEDKDKLVIKVHNLEIEIQSFKEALKRSHDEKLAIIQKANEMASEIESLRSQLRCVIDSGKKDRSSSKKTIDSLQELIEQISKEYKENIQALEHKFENGVINQNENLTEIMMRDRVIESQRRALEDLSKRNNELSNDIARLENSVISLNQTNAKYIDMLQICEKLFDQDFEEILEESLAIIRERKEMKKEVHNIVEKCTFQLLNA